MEYDEFRRYLGKAGLTNKAFAEIVKVSRNSVTNFKKNGGVQDHWAIVAMLMGVMADNGLDFREPLSRIGIDQKKARGKCRQGSVWWQQAD